MRIRERIRNKRELKKKKKESKKKKKKKKEKKKKTVLTTISMQQIVPPICCKCRLRASRWLILDVHLLKLAKDPDVKQGRETDGFGFQKGSSDGSRDGNASGNV